MKRFPLTFCIAVFLIAAAAYIGINTLGSSIETDANHALARLARQITAAEGDKAAAAPNEIHLKKDTVHALQVSENTTPSTDSTTTKNFSDIAGKVIPMPIIFIICILVIGVIVVVGGIIGITAYTNKNTYFSCAGSADRLEAIGFFINKHTIFRRFSLGYSIIHYIFNVLSLITTLITVYMIVDTSAAEELQIIFLLLAAIFSSLVITLRFDKIGGCYAQAMRVLEKAILTYLADTNTNTNKDMTPLVDANTKAEQIIENNYF